MAQVSTAHVNIGQGSGEGRALALDIFQPESASTGTAVILLHGGAWRFGSSADMVPYAEDFAARGFIAICAEYRLLGEAPWPAQLDDVLSVIAWVQDHAANLGITAGRIVLQGYSAGGHLALLAATRKQVAAVVSFFAPSSLLADPAAPGPNPADMLLGPGADPAVAAQASPIEQIGAGFPPTFLLGGTDDPMVRPAALLALYEFLREHGATAELHLYSGHTHEFCRLPSMLSPVQAEVSLFLHRNVVDPETYVRENLELNMFARPGGPAMPPHTAAHG